MIYAEIDFEFNGSAEKKLNLVCGTIILHEKDASTVHEFWLYNDQKNQDLMVDFIENLSEDTLFIAHGATAEARCFLTLGLDPRDYKWVDTYFEMRQLQNCNDKYCYGRYFKDGVEKRSVPPHQNPRRNKGKDMNEISPGLVGAVGRMLGKCRDSKHKDEMRDLIISAPKSFTREEAIAIQEYCTEDCLDLRNLWRSIQKPLKKMTGFDDSTLLDVQMWRGRYAANLAHMERTGFPIDMPALQNLIRNTDQIKKEAIENCNKVYPFFRRKQSKNLKPEWTFTKARFNEYVKQSGQADKWPRSEKTGAFKTDTKTMEKFRFLNEIETLHQTNKLLRNLSWFADYEDSRFKDSMGSDGVLRPFFGAFGTQTGRNAPPASQFILAMSSWLRVLVRPSQDRAIISIDYASQEFAIGAICSKDENLADSYRSGDPYLAFAKLCGAVPKDGTKATHPKERQLYKSVVLGLSYGMRAASLAGHISASVGYPVSEKEAQKYIDQHEKVYKTYWKWREQVLRYHTRQGRYVLVDGWTLGPDNSNSLSVQNFPIQGIAQCVLREAMDKSLDAGVEVMSGLHDAIYAMADATEAEEKAKVLGQAMTKAVKDILWEENDPSTHLDIGLDLEIHYHDDDWVEDKGRTDYENYNRFLKYMETDQDLEQKILKEVYDFA